MFVMSCIVLVSIAASQAGMRRYQGMFIPSILDQVYLYRGLPGRCAKISKLQFAAFQRQVCEVSHNIAANPWQVCEDQFNKCYQSSRVLIVKFYQLSMYNKVIQSHSHPGNPMPWLCELTLVCSVCQVMRSLVINHVLSYARITNQFMFTMIRMQFNVHITVSLHIGTTRII